jgi:hypothetical protein
MPVFDENNPIVLQNVKKIKVLDRDFDDYNFLVKLVLIMPMPTK